MATESYRRSARTGMSIVELLVALTVFGIVITTSVAFMAHENTAFQTAIKRMVGLRNLRYAITTLSQDLETAGTNVPDGQPQFIYGDSDVVVFAADYATNIANDPFAVFHDPDAPSGQVRAPDGALSIPNTSHSTPDTVYESAPGVRSPAEILFFYLARDSSTDRTDDYVLYRRVNDGQPEEIARNLLRSGTDPFFSFERIAEDGGGQDLLREVPDSLMPIYHSAKIHLSAADSGSSALADSVRAVWVRLQATNGLDGADEKRVHLSRLIPLPNAGRGKMATCGSRPLLGESLTATAVTLVGGETAVDLTWGQAVDEAGGEGDVVRYVIWRRSSGATDWGDPYVAVPAGDSTYTYEDAAVTPGTTYEYALAAQDCSPSLSTLSVSASVTP